MTDKNRVYIFDTTMRDGEQSPGASMSLEEKIQISRVFDELGVDIIEAGFPIASPGDFEAVSEISKILKNSIPAGLSRHSKKDIDRCYEALKHAPRFRIHTFISTSPLHMKHKLNKSPEEVYESIKEHVTYARKFTDDVEWSCEDGTRTDMDYMCKTVELAINCGAKTINIPDTVGYTVPSEFTKIIQTLLNKVPNIDKAILSTHCHNDLGLAVANSLAGVQAGARQIECTINGIGERAGNAALEEIVMCLKTRKDKLNYFTDIDTSKIATISHLVSTITGFNVQPNKAIVGKNAFAHESGIHQDGMLKNANTYEIITPESVGFSSSELVLGKHSGRHAFKVKLNDLGFEFNDKKINLLFKKFKDLADRKKQIYEEDLLALIDDKGSSSTKEYLELIDISISCGSSKRATAKIKIKISDKTKILKKDGNGPIDAIFSALKNVIPNKINLLVYQVNAITKGTDAIAEVSVRIEEESITVLGQGSDLDTFPKRNVRRLLNGLLQAGIDFRSGGRRHPVGNRHVVSIPDRLHCVRNRVEGGGQRDIFGHGGAEARIEHRDAWI